VLRPETKVWTSKYLNNLVGQDHRSIKQRIYPMLGFESFGNVTVTISGIELAQGIRKGQFDTSAVTTREGTGVPQVWDVVLAT
jgi:transposase-like protein